MKRCFSYNQDQFTLFFQGNVGSTDQQIICIGVGTTSTVISGTVKRIFLSFRGKNEVRISPCMTTEKK